MPFIGSLEMMEEEPYSVTITVDDSVEHKCYKCGGDIYSFEDKIHTAFQGYTMGFEPVGPRTDERWYHIGCI